MNDNISYLYMIYQAVVMGASLLAPATVSLRCFRFGPRCFRFRSALLPSLFQVP